MSTDPDKWKPILRFLAYLICVLGTGFLIYLDGAYRRGCEAKCYPYQALVYRPRCICAPAHEDRDD